MHRAQHVLYESEAALRLVDHELRALCEDRESTTHESPDSGETDPLALQGQALTLIQGVRAQLGSLLQTEGATEDAIAAAYSDMDGRLVAADQLLQLSRLAWLAEASVSDGQRFPLR